MAEDTDLVLPPLREDITLHEGPKTIDGYPSWSLYDPTRNQYFRIGWLEFQLLSHWSSGKASQIIEQINHHTTLTINVDQVKTFIQFLVQNNLLQFSPKTAAKELLTRKKFIQARQLKNMARSYLFFRIPLFHPDKFITATLPFVKVFYTKIFYIILAMTGIISLYLVSRQWEQFTNTFWYFFNWNGLIYYILAILVTKVFHEFAHAYTAKYYGTRITTMGIMFIVFWPVLYTDTTDAWRLTSRYQRMAIDAAGVTAELILAIIATLFWIFLSDGPMRSAMFFIATISWTFSIFVNLNPSIRFDGYYLLTDWLNITNLQQRGFALGRWRLRELILKLGEPKPQHFSKRTENIVLAYAYATWIYRFFLFLAIALLVYHLFFKLLGIILVALEITLFIIAPIYRELREYWRRKDSITPNKNVIISGTVIFLALLLLFIPWRSAIHAPALLIFGQETKIYAPEASQLIAINVKENQQVSKGETLIKLSSPKLNYHLKQTAYDIQILRYRIHAEFGKSKQLGFKQADEEQLATKLSEFQAYLTQQKELTVTAPFSGEIVYVADGLRPERWISKNAYLIELVNANAKQLTAYVPEKNIRRIQPGSIAAFYPDEPNLPKIKAKVVQIEKANTKELSRPYLASIYGGDIPVEKNHDNKLTLKEAMYRIHLRPETKLPQFTHVTTGTIVLKGKPESLIYRVWVKLSAVIIRESGF